MRSFLLILLFTFSFKSYSQTDPDKIKVRKNDSEFYFFQQGKRSDTISSNNNLFVMHFPKSKRCTYKIEIQNGQLLKTRNDTIFKLVKLNNLNYIHYYADSLTTVKNSNIPDKCSKYTVAIDGANNLNRPNEIRIRFVNSFNDSTMLVNKFYFK